MVSGKGNLCCRRRRKVEFTLLPVYQGRYKASSVQIKKSLSDRGYGDRTRGIKFWPKLTYFQILGFVDRPSLYNLVNKVNLLHIYFQCVYFLSLRLSGAYVPIIRRNSCIYATPGTSHSVWMTVWYARWNETHFHPAYQTVIHTE